jgi:hypothetical protein
MTHHYDGDDSIPLEIVLILAAVVYATCCLMRYVGGLLLLWWRHDPMAQRDEELANALLEPVDDLTGAGALVGSPGGLFDLPPSKPGRRLFMMSVVAGVKNTMGTPSRNAANVLVVRRMARQAMELHGLRPTHIAQVLPLIVEAVFVESEIERAASSWGARVRARRSEWFGTSWGAEPKA